MIGSEVITWLVVGFIFLVLEIATPGVVFVFFGLGAWLVLGLRLLFPLSVPFQVLIFIIASVAFLVMFRRYLKAIMFRQREEERVDSLSERMVADNYLGQEVDVINDISPERPGRIELNGTSWIATSVDSLPVGVRARVVEVVGTTVTVEKI
ncbi:MAG: NfeD family protein [Deltaproteobacteria bacterium]|jgi:membrane protein implicated in regulation of membrane protease activity|nr:NfeD family protein [Deltaproteobacteria bacterium]